MDDNMGEHNAIATMVGQSRRVRRLVQVAAEQFAYINPILDWIGRAAVKEENK